MTEHPTDEAIADLITRGHGAPSLERHVAECDECAARLAQEALLEEALFEAAESRPARASLGGWLIAGLAAAASGITTRRQLLMAPGVSPWRGAGWRRANPMGATQAARVARVAGRERCFITVSGSRWTSTGSRGQGLSIRGRSRATVERRCSPRGWSVPSGDALRGARRRRRAERGAERGGGRQRSMASIIACALA